MMAHALPILRLENVSVVYPGAAGEASFILEPVSLTVRRGEWVAVMGANGSGKSTLARVIVGLLRPTSGTVRFGSGAGEDGPRAGLRIGYLSQHPEHHIVGPTVLEDLLLALEPLGLPEAETSRRSRRWLQRVGLAGKEAHRTDRLSGGELQRAALAGLLVCEPDLLILDEPNAFVDPQGATLVRQVIAEYVRGGSAAVVWITHDAEDVSEADRVAVLHRGQLCFDGSPEALWQQGERLLEWGIGPLEHVESEGTLAQRKSVPAGAALVMEDVAFSYTKDGPAVLSGVDLEVREGESVALLGASGSGKSTLLGVAALLEKREAGTLKVLGSGIPLQRGSVAEKRQFRRLAHLLQPCIGFGMQQPEKQLFGASVREDFYFGFRNLNVPWHTWDERIEQALRLVGLDEQVLDRSPFTLSGGEARKVALAVTVAMQPRLYLLDEPTVNLDFPSRRAVINLIRGLARDEGRAVLFATHDRLLAAEAADRRVTLTRGRIDGNDPVRANEGQGAGSGRPADDVDQEPERELLRTVDPRVPVLTAFFLALSVAAVRSWTGLVTAFLVVSAVLLLTKQPWRPVLGTFVGLLPFMAVTVLFARDEISDGGGGLFLALRMFLTVVSVLWVTRVLALNELMRAFAMVLRPLRRIGFPIEAVLAATLVAIRMVPVLAEEARAIGRAQVMRGAGRLRGPGGVWRRLLSLVVPLNAAVFRRAEQIGDALALRGYLEPGAWATRSHSLSKRDWAVLFLALCASLLVVAVDLGGA